MVSAEEVNQIWRLIAPILCCQWSLATQTHKKTLKKFYTRPDTLLGLSPIDWAGAVTLKNSKKAFKPVLIELSKIFCVAFNIFNTEDLDMKE